MWFALVLLSLPFWSALITAPLWLTAKYHYALNDGEVLDANHNLPMTFDQAKQVSRVMARRLWQQVDHEVVKARTQWADKDDADRGDDYWIAVAMEEMGKTARAVNKLRIAIDPKVREQWQAERARRIATTIATLRRMWEVSADGAF